MLITDKKFLVENSNIFIDTTAKTITLSLTNILTQDGVSLLAIFNKLTEIWETPIYAGVTFPIVKVSDSSFILIDGWNFEETSKGLIRNAGWAVRDTEASLSKEEYANIITSSIFISPYQFYYTQTAAGTPTSFSTAGNQNKAIKIYGDSSHGNFDYRSYLKIIVTLNSQVVSSMENSTLGFSTLTYQSYTFSMPSIEIFSYDYLVKGLTSAKTVSSSTDRYMLTTWPIANLNINGMNLYSNSITIDLSSSSNWDADSTTYATAANRAGKDFYIYGVNNSGNLKYILSANSSAPTGYTTTTSLKVGGFHCLCLSVGTIVNHTLSDYVTGDILPASVWCLNHKPFSAAEGMVYSSGLDKWIDIYLASVSSGKLVSVFNGTIADGASSEIFNWYKFVDWLGAIGKRIPYQFDFFVYAAGSNQGTNISTSADPNTTGGHSDTSSIRMISNIGCEDCCGAMWQWGMDSGAGTDAWKAAYGGIDTGVAGAVNYEAPRILLGGGYSSGSYAGSRSADWSISPFYLGSTYAIRGISHSK